MDAGARIRVTTDDLRELRVFVTVKLAELAKIEATSTPFELVVRDVASADVTARAVHFQKPAAVPRRSP